MLVLPQNIATCGFMPSTGFQRASDPVQFFLNLKIVRLVTECFLRIGIKKSCLILELLTSPSYQLEQKLIQQKLCWSDQVAHLLAMTKTMEEEEASLSEHPGIAIVRNFIPSHQNIIPSNHRWVLFLEIEYQFCNHSKKYFIYSYHSPLFIFILFRAGD